MKLSIREKIMLICFAMIGLGYCFYTFLYAPLTDDIDSIADENIRLQSQVDKYADRVRQSEGIPTADQQQLMSSFQEESVKVPGEILLPECLSYIQKSVNESRVTLNSINLTPADAAVGAQTKPSNAVGATKAKELKITVEVKGGYSGLRSFLLAIQKAPRIYRIDKTKLQSQYNKDTEKTVAAVTTAIATNGEMPTMPVVTNDITMEVTMVTFYDELILPGYEDKQPRVQPGKGQDNPFTI